MQLARSKGRIGVSGIILVMVCICVFVGSLFYLTLNGPWRSNTLFPMYPVGNTNYDKSTELDNYQPNLDEVITELKKEGCIITSYNKQIDLSGAVRLQYHEFKEKAVKHGLVFIISDKNGDASLLVSDKVKWLWTPG